MPARLLPLTRPGSAPIPLNRPVQLVGRHPECDIRIDAPQVSRRHCVLALVGDRVMLRDLGSQNGIWLNGRRIEECTLADGDEIAIGHLIYRLEEGASQPTFGPTPAFSEPFAPPVDEPAPDRLDNLPIDLGDEFSLRD